MIIGQAASPRSRPQIVHAGIPRWHALLTFPQREAAAKQWLAVRGVYSFYPVRLVRRDFRGKVLEFETRYLPGYVFVLFSGEPVWHLIIHDEMTGGGSPYVRSVIRLHSGEPGWLREETLTAPFASHGRRISPSRSRAAR